MRFRTRVASRALRSAVFSILLGSLTACTLAPPPTLIPLAQVPIIPTAPAPLPPPATRPAQDQIPAPVAPASEAALGAPPEPTRPNLPYPTPPGPGIQASDAELLFSAPVPQASEIMEWRPPCVAVPHSLHPNDHYWLRRPIPSGKVDWGLDWYAYGSNGFGQWQTHHGMDFPNDPGTPVLAAGDGVVIWVTGDWVPVYIEVEATAVPDGEAALTDEAQESEGETDSPEVNDTDEEAKPQRRVIGPYGNFIIIRHDWGWRGQPVYTLYGHLLEVFVQEGDRVKGGDLIAGVGNTGASSGPHLHFEVRLGENDYSHTVNPALWMAPYEGWGTLVGQVTSAQGTWLFNAVLTIAPADLDRELDEGDTRTLTTYANNQGRPDESWLENFVVADMPAGEYHLSVRAGGELLKADVTIRPGATTFVRIHTSPGRVITSPPPPTPTGTPE